jgi:EmrB/QacA subfamily drug resistance transporter
MFHLHARWHPPLVGTTSPGSPPGEGWLRRVLIVVALAQICVTIDYWALSVALPPIARGLRVTTTDLQWALSAYLVAFAAPLIAAGRFGDIFGRRRVLLLGVALFGAASALCGAAPSMAWLVTGRVVQGLGAALLFPTSMAVLSDAFPPERRDRAIGAIVGLAGIGAAAGPFVGGFVAEHLGWRWIFYLNVPVAVAAILIGSSTLRESRDESAPRQLDVLGLFAVSAGVVCLVLAIDRAPDQGWTAPSTLAVFGAGLILLAAFVLVEARVHAPLVDLGLLRDPVFVWLGFTGAVSNVTWCLVLFCVTLYLQQVRGLSVFQAGVLFLPLSAGAAVAGPLSGHLARRVSAPNLMASGMLLCGAAVFVLTVSTSWLVYVPALATAGVGLGLAYATTNAGTLAAAPAAKAGAASGIVLTGLLIAAALAVTLTASLVEEFQKGTGPAAENHAIDLVLRIGAGLSGGAALLLLIAHPAEAKSSGP